MGSDTKEVKQNEGGEKTSIQEPFSVKAGDAGKRSVQGPPEVAAPATSPHTADHENLATIHPSEGPENLPNVEAEPIATIPIKDQKSTEGRVDSKEQESKEGPHQGAESKMQMPEGHHPGGPEAW